MTKLTLIEKRRKLELLLRRKAEQSKLGGPRELGELELDVGRRHEPFPLTHIQRAYLAGRLPEFELGGTSCHSYFESESSSLDVSRLQIAFNSTLMRHEMLRARVVNENYQAVLPEVPFYEFRREYLEDLSPEARDARLFEIRESMATRCLDPKRDHPFDIRITTTGPCTHRIHVDFDLLFMDAASISLVLETWRKFYEGETTDESVPELSFRDYVVGDVEAQKSEKYAAAKDYWQSLGPTLPPAPQLPQAKHPREITGARFRRRQGRLSVPQWGALRALATELRVTPTVVLCTAYAETLAAFSQKSNFTLTQTLFNRAPVHPDIQNLVGEFTTTLLLGVDLSQSTFGERARAIQDQLASDLNHTAYTGLEVLRDLSLADGAIYRAAMPVVFTSLLGMRRDAASFTRWLGDPVYGTSQTPQVSIDHQIFEERGELVFNWDFVDDLFPEGVPQAIFELHLRRLQALSEHGEVADHAELLGVAERATRDHYNATSEDWQEPMLLHARLMKVIAEHPEKLALISPSKSLDFGELGSRALGIAVQLRAAGVGANELVAVYCDKGWEQAVACLAVLMAGGAYLPVSADLPVERAEYLLGRTRLGVVLVQSHVDAVAWARVNYRCIDIDTAKPAPSEAALEWEAAAPDDLAYVIYTSGSTGVPKGVVIDHKGASNTCLDISNRWDFCDTDRVVSLASLSFDLSVFDLFGVLGVGGAVVLPSVELAGSPEHWLDLVDRHEVTVWNTVPTMLELAVEWAETSGRELGRLRLALLSGDWIPVGLPDRARSLTGALEVVSLGGATEASIWSIFYPIGVVAPSWSSIPYGRPLANQEFYVLDEHLRDRPRHVAGDLYIGGVGLARGYRDDDEQTRSSFIVHPTSGQRLYRIGDRGRFLASGDIEFLGRQDLQVKIGGHRIELGDVEAAIASHPSVERGVASAVGKNKLSRQLVGYYVLQRDADLSTESLLAYLGTKLPPYMVPKVAIRLESIPLSSNAKVDRKRLPAPWETTAGGIESTDEDSSEVVELREWLMDRVAERFEIPRDQLDINTPLANYGLESLRGMQLSADLSERLDIKVELRLIWEQRTIASLARAAMQLAQDQPGGYEPFKQVEPDLVHAHEAFPLNEVQQAYWLGRGDGFSLGAVSCHLYAEFEREDLDLDRLQLAWNALVRRHGALRTVVEDGQQTILPAVPEYTIKVRDLSDQLPEAKECALSETRERMAHQLFDTAKWPLFEISADRLEGNKYRLQVGFDLLISDVWSFIILIDEWARLYDRPDAELEPLIFSFRDYVLADQGVRESQQYATSLEYWRDRVVHLPPPPQLPLAKQPEQIKKPRFVRRQHKLTASRWESLGARARGVGITPSMVLCAAYAQTIGRWSTESDFTLNLTLFNRAPHHPDVPRIVGDFTSLGLLEVRGAEGGVPFVEFAEALQSQLLMDLEHRVVNGVRVLGEWTRAQGSTASAPVVFTSAVGLTSGSAGDEVISKTWLGECVFSVSETPQVWLDHQVVEDNGFVTLSWDAVEELFPEALLDEMFGAYVELVEALATSEPAWSQAPSRGAALQSRPLQADANETDGPIPTELLHSGLSTWAHRTPEALAVITPARRLSYAQLDTAAHRIAKGLCDLGVGPGDLVPIVMDKGWQQVATCFGILRTGAAYLPIDASVPRERLQLLLKESRAETVVISSGEDGSSAIPSEYKILVVGELDWEGAVEPFVSPDISPDALAYVIFTSGSTGVPKGVMIEHHAALNTCVDINDRFSVCASDRVFGISALSFDLSVWDVFGAMAAGATLVLPGKTDGRDPSQWLPVMVSEGVTVWNSAPPLMGILLEYLGWASERLPDSLRLVLLSGDWIPLVMAQSLVANPDLEVISLGGATEASIWSIAHPIAAVEPGWTSIPYGRALRNQSVYVLDRFMAPCPVWGTGGIYIGGVGLARGYWQDEEKTRGSFVEHPISGERLYKTGDLGRFMPNGSIEFLGRADNQVKIQGHRIELGEIEAVLRDDARVADAIVIAHGENKAERSLVAYFVGLEADLDPDTLGAALEKRLPSYMVPRQIMQLQRLPLSVNGKVDRKALPKPGKQVRVHVPPATVLEHKLAEIWTELLGVETPSVDTSFFDMGGYSQLAVAMTMTIRERLAVDLPVRSLFESPTIRALAERLESTQTKRLRGRIPENVSPSRLYSTFARRGIGERLGAFRLDKNYVRARGDHLTMRLSDGRDAEVLDMVGGYGSTFLGHNHPELVELSRAMLTDSEPFHAQHSNNYAAGRLCQQISQRLRPWLGEHSVITLASSGTEAVEAGIKHAKMEYRRRASDYLSDLDNMSALTMERVRRGEVRLSPATAEQASEVLGVEISDAAQLCRAIVDRCAETLDNEPCFVALSHAFHGMTSGALSLTANDEFRDAFRWMGLKCSRIAPEISELDREVSSNTYSIPFIDVDGANEIVLKSRQWSSVAAIVLEPIQGEGGIFPLPRDFLSAARGLADRHQFPLMLDEIQCGMGRSGHFTASETLGVRGDYYVFSKSLGGGLAKVAALSVIESRYEPDFGFLHGSTFAEDAPGCRIASAGLDIAERDGLLEAASNLGAQFKAKLLGLKTKYPTVIQDVRGLGLMLGVELCSQERSPSLMLRAMEAGDEGTLSQLVAGFLLNEHGIRIAPTKTRRTIRFLPSAYIKPEDMDIVVAGLARACEMIEKVNLGRLMKYVVNAESRADDEPIVDWRSKYPTVPIVEPREGEPRVAMIGHVEDQDRMLQAEPSFAELTEAERDELALRMFKFFKPGVGQQIRVTSPTGETVHLVVIALPLTAQMIERMMRGTEEERDLLLSKIAEARDVGCHLGASMVGFGGYTSIATLNCTTVSGTAVPVTSGNAYTVAVGVESAVSEFVAQGGDLSEARVGVVGAGGNIGSIAARLLAARVGHLVLVGRDKADARLSEVERSVYASAWRTQQADSGTAGAAGAIGRIVARAVRGHEADLGVLGSASQGERIKAWVEQELPGGLVTLDDRMFALRDCDLIISATNASVPVIRPEHLSTRVRVIGDVAVPADVDPLVEGAFEQIRVLSGGIVRLPPGNELLLSGSGLPAGHLFGCMAETTLLGLAKHEGDFSVGTITETQVQDILDLAKRHGYEPAVQNSERAGNHD